MSDSHRNRDANIFALVATVGAIVAFTVMITLSVAGNDIQQDSSPKPYVPPKSDATPKPYTTPRPSRGDDWDTTSPGTIFNDSTSIGIKNTQDWLNMSRAEKHKVLLGLRSTPEGREVLIRELMASGYSRSQAERAVR